MDISSLTSELRTQCEIVFYLLSREVDKDIAEKLSKEIVKLNLEDKIKEFKTLLACTEVGYKKSDELNTQGFEQYSMGIKLLTDVRKKTYTDAIERLSNKIKLLELI